MTHRIISAPRFPFALRTKLTTIDENTPLDLAREVMRELEVLYNHHFNDGSGENKWTWDDVHNVDRDVMVELEEVIRAWALDKPVNEAIVCAFRTERWKEPYKKMYDMLMNALGGDDDSSAPGPPPS